MDGIYNSDKPIVEKEQDRFSRFKFANRIAETIIHRNNNDGLVIGLYGIWGEGKSSILNMIENELSNSQDVLIVKFNPWRFKDEDSLILNFLTNLSKTLDIELRSKTEKIGQFIKKYGAVTSVLNLDLSNISAVFPDTELEDLKHRVNDFLKESEKKIVVIIDDIDRLDKQELFSLFKLIKLTGDFAKTYYILSFDDEMVASAIGERFAEGNNRSGHNFLEKIIQVPLRIPQALTKDLLVYTFELLNKVLSENQITFIDDENLEYLISQNLLVKINTPRLAVRYANSLSFLIPLLKGEVNISDLILFEGIKIFYPGYYDFIKSSPEYFIESYHNVYSHKTDDVKAEEFKDEIKKLNIKYSRNEQQSIINLLKHLFPFIQEALENYSYGNGDQTWMKEKRIASPKYFNRYFIYSVPKDEISDVYFDSYINNISTEKYEDVFKATDDMFLNIDPIQYLNKINIHEVNLDWTSRKIVSKLICENQHRFEGVKGGSFGLNLFSSKSQAATAITRLISGHNNYSERLDFAKTLMNEDVSFKFSKELIRWFKVSTTKEDQTINKSDVKLLSEILLNRALSDCAQNKTNLFEKYSEYIYFLFDIWYQNNPIEVEEYFEGLIISNEKFVEIIIDSFASTIYSSTRQDPYKVDFKKESYELLIKYYDKDILYKSIQANFGNELEREDVVFFDVDEGQTNLNAMRQFVHFYKLNSASEVE